MFASLTNEKCVAPTRRGEREQLARRCCSRRAAVCQPGERVNRTCATGSVLLHRRKHESPWEEQELPQNQK